MGTWKNLGKVNCSTPNVSSYRVLSPTQAQLANGTVMSTAATRTYRLCSQFYLLHSTLDNWFHLAQILFNCLQLILHISQLASCFLPAFPFLSELYFQAARQSSVPAAVLPRVLFQFHPIWLFSQPSNLHQLVLHCSRLPSLFLPTSHLIFSLPYNLQFSQQDCQSSIPSSENLLYLNLPIVFLNSFFIAFSSFLTLPTSSISLVHAIFLSVLIFSPGPFIIPTKSTVFFNSWSLSFPTQYFFFRLFPSSLYLLLYIRRFSPLRCFFPSHILLLPPTYLSNHSQQ